MYLQAKNTLKNNNNNTYKQTDTTFILYKTNL
jgi:hypothetical protein